MEDFSFDDKYVKQEGRIVLTGLQALVRLPLDQHRADRRAGLNTATLITGYRGSPVAGLDMLFEQQADLLREHQAVFMPGVNEDLAATAVFGSQIANTFPDPRYDGVLGMWYGKAPGVDRSGDVFKHGNFAGVGRYGGVLAVAGDDPIAKSSTLPSQSELALYDAQMPILYPGDIQEVIELGRYGFELSRYSGTWVGFKIVTDIADGFGTAQVRVLDDIVRPEFEFAGRPWQPTQDTRLVAPYSLQLEYELAEGRLEAARRFAAANNLNHIATSTGDDWLGIVAAGKTYYDLREALDSVGLHDDELNRRGIRLLKISMPFPLDPQTVRYFARGLDQILVIEEKRSFIEMFIRDILYNEPERPLVLGKRDENGQPLVRADDELDVDQITQILINRLAPILPEAMYAHRAAQLASQPVDLPMATDLSRSPYFCSGCPHNRSTVLPEGSIAGGGIGCHGMVHTMERNHVGITHMGGEGVQWVGAAPFSGMGHMFQNLGDGTLAHSGYLAIRQAVAAGTNITYKILYNEAVAMTGAQPVDGNMPVPELTRALHAEGVKRIIVCADDPEKYPPGTMWAPDVTVWHRDKLDEAQLLLRDEPGVTVLIYDQPCAADLRRKRRRGQVEDPPVRVFINEAVCEGCGDCGVKSNCLSVVPVETEFGRKTQIHQASCNKDYTCLEGDCPSFITVTPAEGYQKPKPRIEVNISAEELPEPERLVGESANLFMVGIGGTGVVTVNQILGTAAHLEGKTVRNLDQTGLSQKGGPVLSHIKISTAPQAMSSKIGTGAADAYLCLLYT
ncbi:MAG: indolepyruvate ferredoxin oxidoreductase family protein, partial [Chloroflexi bacterium]|nr:indolepyruvate ferredoxin oxidoreductase family protein [Chloroflexota bacterium]